MTPPSDAIPDKIIDIAHLHLLPIVFSVKIGCLFGNKAGITFFILHVKLDLYVAIDCMVFVYVSKKFLTYMLMNWFIVWLLIVKCTVLGVWYIPLFFPSIAVWH